MSSAIPATRPSETTAPEERRKARDLLVPEMWASLAITVMWLTVLLDALFGPDMVFSGPTSMTTIPSAVVVALFALLGTRVVAKYGLGRTEGTGLTAAKK